MSRNNVVQVEFRVTGSGLRDFGVLGQAALNLQNSIGATAGRFAELERASAAASGALAHNAQTFEELARSLRHVDTASRQAGDSLEGLRGVTEIARNFGPLGAAAGAAADRIGTLVQGAASAGSAIPIVGLAVAAAALQFYAFAKAAEFAVGSVFSLAEATIPKAEALKAALAGLTSVARFKGITAEEATSTVQNLDLVKNGLLSVADASTALKNLLAAGFGLKESAVLVERFGDAAAFGKQSALSFGQAVVSGTEGIKNQNSILVDNVGITKNLSVILKEAGFEMQDLSDATKGAAARQALFNGLLRESQGQVGDAAKLASSYSGQLAKIDATFTAIEASIGQFFTSNKALNDVLAFVDRSLQLISKDSAAWGTALAGLLPILQVGVSVISVLVEALAGVSAAVALAVKGIGSADEALGQLTGNAELEAKGRNLRIAGDDLLKISTDAALVAANLPVDVGKINESLGKIGQPSGAQSQGISIPDLFNKGLDALIAGARQRFAQKQAIQRTELEADIKVNDQARKIQEQYIQILRSGGAQAQALLDQRAAFARRLIAATTGTGPGDDLSARLGEIDQQAASRLAAETERIAKLKRDSNAIFYASAGDRWALENGAHDGDTTYAPASFPAVKVDREVRDGDTVSLGAVKLTATLTPGHTKGCTTWSTTASEGGRTLRVIFPCSLNSPGNVLVGNKAYPNIVADYERSFAIVDKMKADIALPAHPEAGEVLERGARRKNGDENAFVDPGLLQRIVAQSRAGFKADLEKQKRSK